MAIPKKRMLAAVVAAVFMQATSVYAMNNEQGAAQEEDQKYAAEDQGRVVVRRDKIEVAMSKRNESSGDDMNELDASLWGACFWSSVDAFCKLLESGANANALDDEYVPLLLSAVDNGVSLKKVGLLIEYGADLHVRHSNGDTPLLRAIERSVSSSKVNGSEKIMTWAIRAIFGDAITYGSLDRANNSKQAIKMLVAAKVDVNQCSPDGISPLMLACEKDLGDVAQVLLDAGACVHARAHDERTVFDFVKSGSSIGQLLLAKEEEKHLVQEAMPGIIQEFLKIPDFAKLASEYAWAPCYCEEHKANVVEEDAALEQESAGAAEVAVAGIAESEDGARKE